MNDTNCYLDFLDNYANVFLTYMNCTNKPRIVFLKRCDRASRIDYYGESNTIIFNAADFTNQCKHYALLIVLDELYRYVYQKNNIISPALSFQIKKAWVVNPLQETTIALECFMFMHRYRLITDFGTYLDILHSNAHYINTKNDNAVEILIGTLSTIRQYCSTQEKVIYTQHLFPAFSLALSFNLDTHTTEARNISVPKIHIDAWKTLAEPLSLARYDFNNMATYLTKRYIEFNGKSVDKLTANIASFRALFNSYLEPNKNKISRNKN